MVVLCKAIPGHIKSCKPYRKEKRIIRLFFFFFFSLHLSWPLPFFVLLMFNVWKSMKCYVTSMPNFFKIGFLIMQKKIYLWSTYSYYGNMCINPIWSGSIWNGTAFQEKKKLQKDYTYKFILMWDTQLINNKKATIHMDDLHAIENKWYNIINIMDDCWCL